MVVPTGVYLQGEDTAQVIAAQLEEDGFQVIIREI